jgi:hypothetical protein
MNARRKARDKQSQDRALVRALVEAALLLHEHGDDISAAEALTVGQHLRHIWDDETWSHLRRSLVRRLWWQGWGVAALASTLSVDPRTVRGWLEND